METNINKEYSDRGMTFPIKLNNGGWYPTTGTYDLVKQNLQALIVYELGFRIRQEDFGTRLWECIEEPNTVALNYLVAEFIKDAIRTYEGRVTFVKSIATRKGSSLHIEFTYKLTGNNSSTTLGIDYNI